MASPAMLKPTTYVVVGPMKTAGSVTLNVTVIALPSGTFGVELMVTGRREQAARFERLNPTRPAVVDDTGARLHAKHPA